MPTLAEPTHEVWIVVTNRDRQIYGEALIGLVYTDDDGNTHEVLAAVPGPQTRVEYRPISRGPTLAGD